MLWDMSGKKSNTRWLLERLNWYRTQYEILVNENKRLKRLLDGKS